MEWIAEAETLADFIDHGKYTIETKPFLRCKDCRKYNVKAGYKEDCCPLYEWRGMSYGHEHDYQYCSYAERRTE